jgi:Na+/glutamate symporter
MLQYLRGGLGDCIFGFVYLMELSTPFVSFRGILSRLKVSLHQFHWLQYLACSSGKVFHVVSMFQMKSSQLYVINGLVMLVTFFFCRVIMFPYVFYLYSRIVGLSYWEVRISGLCVLTIFA